MVARTSPNNVVLINLIIIIKLQKDLVMENCSYNIQFGG